MNKHYKAKDGEDVPFSFEVLRERIERIAERIEMIGGMVREITIKDPAKHEQIDLVEQELGVRLPESFKYALLHFSA
nr:SMI1/KNR4 family protein [Paenibacillus brevis]